tara:strand:- start:1848 stop:2684 length:837 start_codon:yes stop_codon:yes gene_type:complete
MKCYTINNNIITLEDISLDKLKVEIEDFNKRDFYFLDVNLRFDISSLTIKKNCIICKFDNIKAIIFKDNCYIFYDLIENIEQHLVSGTPFHINILEFLFIIVVNIFEKEFSEIYELFNNKLKVDNNFINLQSRLVNLEYRVKELHTVTKELIENNEDMQSLTFDLYDKELLEQMIENYDLKIEDVYYDIVKLLKEFDNIQKIKNIKLAEDRNKYALMNLYISFISLGFSFGAFASSIFGMNLDNFIEDKKYSFIYVILAILFIMALIIICQVIYFLKM